MNIYSKKSRIYDLLAEWFIKICGVLVIVSAVWILVMIARVAAPLFYPPRTDIGSSCNLPSQLSESRILTVGSDDSGQRVFLLDDSGLFHIIEASGGRLIESFKTPSIPAGAGKILSIDPLGSSSYNLIWDNGAVSSVSIAFSVPSGASPKPSISVTLNENYDLSFDARDTSAVRTFVRRLEGQGAIRVEQLPDGRFAVLRRLSKEDSPNNETETNSWVITEEKPAGTITAAAVDQKGRYLYAGTSNGQVMRWDLSEPGAPRLTDTVTATLGSSITALNLALGDISLAVGDADGGYSVWFPTAQAGSGANKRLTRIYNFPDHDGAVVMIAPSFRDKSLLSLNAFGALRIDHITSERTLISIPKSASPLRFAALSARSSALTVLQESGSITIWNLHIPHPEVSLKTLFGKVWYEGYDKPEYVWQSSAASDDFEPKMSLTPLLFGTIKATAFAMMFAIPLALCGALYTSRFMAPRLKSFIKPSVEIMAAIPSVVIGFLAGLWLAPIIDGSLMTLFLSAITIPVCIGVFLLVWRKMSRVSSLERLSRGKEFILLAPVIVLGAFLAWSLSGSLEALVFGGDFKHWLYAALGLHYDQRNCVIISIALGFAVIPIIFTIAEDAISNVPRNLTAASLALGANRWQTAWKVVLPSALPGVFSAVMIGFGRAIGETMIVLMATGNTPIMSWSVFNGLRSLSANIAVEIPEAPLDGSLYRVLFLSAALLFLFTFIINTFAEALRQRFRRKYGRY